LSKKKLIKQQNTQQIGTGTGMISIQPKQMQTRAKHIAKRVQTKKATTKTFAKNYKQKFINSNFAKKNAKKSSKTRKKKVITRYIMFKG